MPGISPHYTIRPFDVKRALAYLKDPFAKIGMQPFQRTAPEVRVSNGKKASKLRVACPECAKKLMPRNLPLHMKRNH